MNNQNYTAPNFSYPQDNNSTYSRTTPQGNTAASPAPIPAANRPMTWADAGNPPSWSQMTGQTVQSQTPGRDFVLWLVQEVNPGFVVPPREDFNSEELEGTFQQLMADNLGAYAIVDFVVGTAGMTTREGFLVAVGRSYIVLYDFNMRTFTVCDAFSIKFVTYPYLDIAALRRYIPREYVAGLPGAFIDESGLVGLNSYGGR